MPHFDPYKLAAMSEDARKAQVEKWTEDAKKHWTVEKGELVNDGNGSYLTTSKPYGGIRFSIEYLNGCGSRTAHLSPGDAWVQIPGLHQGRRGKWNLGAAQGRRDIWSKPSRRR